MTENEFIDTSMGVSPFIIDRYINNRDLYQDINDQQEARKKNHVCCNQWIALFQLEMEIYRDYC